MLDTFALTRNPFPAYPEQEELFWGSPQRRAIALLRSGVESGRGLLCFLGARGTGKTSVLIALARQVEERAPISFIWKPLGVEELAKKLVQDFSVPNAGSGRIEQMAALREFLFRRCQEQLASPIVLVDNAEAMPTATLEEVRLLNNIETDTRKAVQIILSGREELEARLLAPELRQLRQRLGTISRLEPLNFEDTCEYIEFRLRQASPVPQSLFTREALYLLWRECGGVLSEMHRAGRLALELAEARGAHRADLAMMKSATEALPTMPKSRTDLQRNSHLLAELAPQD